jgi:hypothetical protein
LWYSVLALFLSVFLEVLRGTVFTKHAPSELNSYDAIDERIWTAMGTGSLRQQTSWDTDVTVAGDNYVGFHFPSARNHTRNTRQSLCVNPPRVGSTS